MAEEPDRALREWRRVLRLTGQGGSPEIADWVRANVEGVTVIDVGCGAGVTASLLRAGWYGTPAWQQGRGPLLRFVGADSSPRAVDYVTRYGPFDEVRQARTQRIPAADVEFETVLCIENIEHLLAPDVPGALEELRRIASAQVIVTTPWPWDVCNVDWLLREVAAARRDELPLDHEEFGVLAGAIHKSALEPVAMERCGYSLRTPGGLTGPSAIYVGDVDRINHSSLGVVRGLDWQEPPADLDDYRQPYVQLLESALAWAPSMAGVPPRVRLSRSVRAAGQGAWIAAGRVVVPIERAAKRVQARRHA